MRRTSLPQIAAVAALVVAAAGAAPAAQAAEAPQPRADTVTAGESAGTRVDGGSTGWVDAGPPGNRDIIAYADFGTNHNVRLWRERLGGGRYKVWAEQIERSFHGHFHFWGPGLNVNSPNQRWWEDEETGYYYGSGGGTVCVEAWEWVYPGSFWDSIGLPCLPT
jgi:hypothetical protein